MLLLSLPQQPRFVRHVRPRTNAYQAALTFPGRPLESRCTKRRLDRTFVHLDSELRLITSPKGHVDTPQPLI